MPFFTDNTTLLAFFEWFEFQYMRVIEITNEYVCAKEWKQYISNFNLQGTLLLSVIKTLYILKLSFVGNIVTKSAYTRSNKNTTDLVKIVCENLIFNLL